MSDKCSGVKYFYLYLKVDPMKLDKDSSSTLSLWLSLFLWVSRPLSLCPSSLQAAVTETCRRDREVFVRSGLVLHQIRCVVHQSWFSRRRLSVSNGSLVLKRCRKLQPDFHLLCYLTQYNRNMNTLTIFCHFKCLKLVFLQCKLVICGS